MTNDMSNMNETALRNLASAIESIVPQNASNIQLLLFVGIYLDDIAMVGRALDLEARADEILSVRNKRILQQFGCDFMDINSSNNVRPLSPDSIQNLINN